MRVLGLDGGIASIGWGIVEQDEAEGSVVAAGVRAFDAPETDKERTPTNAIRRAKRGLRRVIRRRRQRMTAIRRLFAEGDLLPDADRNALRLPCLDPWTLRAEGLDRLLSGPELAVALGHIAAHRGFLSNSKRDRGANAPPDTSAMLQGVEALRGRLAQWRSVGEMLARDSAIGARKRNRGAFDRTVLRRDLRHEVATLFERQRRFGSAFTTATFEETFAEAAFTQRPLQDSEHLIGPCPFEPDERRTARRSYSFELFRLLSRLNAIRLVSGRAEPQPLSPENIARVAADFGGQKGITYKSLRRLLDLSPQVRFADVALEDEGRDVVARSGHAAEGSYTLRDVVGEAGWRALLHTPTRLDRIAEVLTFRESLDSIRAGLADAGVERTLADAILAAAEAGRFSAFSGAGHISAKAARAIIPHLARGLVYSEACAEAYDHAARPATALSDVHNPVARKALGEMLKQVRVLVAAYGPFDAIHVELARDIGRSADERDKITRGIEDRNKEKDRRRDEFAKLLGRPPTGAEELLRYELWREQNMRCLYTDELIPPQALVALDNSVQVDHILPWSRFGDDSFANKTLCFAAENQRKQGRTPYEWFMAERPDQWERFQACVESCRQMKGRKKRGFYLRRNAAEVEEGFRNRNLGDTRYATRLLRDALDRRYGKAGRRIVLARPGPLTAKLRRAWGLEALKKDAAGARLEDDRHHAVDALAVAATSEAMLQRLTRAFQEAERQGLAREFGAGVGEPWPGFRQQVEAARDSVFVSRPERGRARGETHAATIRQVREIDGAPVVFERKAVEKLTLADLERIPVPAPYGKAADPAKLRDGMVEALRTWIEADKPKDAPPRSPRGDVIRKVRVATRDKPAILLRGGTADRGEMARVDVFRAADAKGRVQFHLVPIYPHQVADRENWPKPPDRAVVAHKPEAGGWTDVGRPGFEFLFSLYQNSLIEVTKRDGEVILGYFRSLNRNGAQIDISPPHSAQLVRAGIGSKLLLTFRKLTVDRLGRISEIVRETRTWHGAACT